MNIYIFNDASSIASVYGIGTYLRELTCAMNVYDVNLTVVHLFSGKPKLEIIRNERVQHWFIPRPKGIEPDKDDKKREVQYYYRNIVYFLRRHIPENTEKLVYHLNYNHCQVMAEGLKAAFDCKLIWVGHFLEFGLYLNGNLDLLRGILSKPQEERNEKEKRICFGFEKEQTLMKTVDHVVSLSTYMKKLFCEEYGIDAKKVTVIPNGLTDTLKNVSSGKIQLRNKWKFSANEKIILFAGRLDLVKGLNYLIRAFREVLKIIPECRLLIAGDGPYNIYMKDSIDICSKITYSGLVSQAELFELYHVADLGIVPSLYEPFGYVATEMMMHGLSMVTTATSGLNELVEDKISTLKVPVRFGAKDEEIDTLLLAKKIVFLLQNTDEANRLKENARKRYEKLYTADVLEKNMYQFYHSLYQ